MSRSPDPRDRESIRHDLASADEEVRRLAVERLVLLPVAEALPILAERLGDDSWRVRKSAVACLAAAPEDWPVAEHLVAALADGENPGRRNAAVEALVRIGRRMVEPLLAATESDDEDVRKLVVDALAGIGSERAVPRLAAMLRDQDPNVRGAAADALGAIGGSEAASALRESALGSDAETLVRFAALRGLARLETPLDAAELAPALADPLLRPVAFAVLGHTEDSEGEEVLLKGLQSGSRAAREAAIEGLLRRLARLEPAAAETLAGRMRDTACATPQIVADALPRLASADLGVRLQLVQFLGIAQAPGSALSLLLAARDEALAEVALSTLAGFGADAERMVDAHWDGFDADVRALACDLLARGDGAAGVARLVAALADVDPGVRGAAARGLARRADPSALAPLLRRLEATAGDAEPEADEEREAATEALVQIVTALADGSDLRPRREALALLAGAFEGAAEPVRLALARALGVAGDGQQASLLALLAQDPSPAVRRAAVGALARVGGAAVGEWLRLALADEDAAVRTAAAGALGDLAEPEARSDLERLLGDEDASVRAAAVRAIGELSLRAGATAGGAIEPALREVLARALGDAGPVAIAAVETCERLGGGALDAVRGVLGHADPEVVQSAVRGLRARGRDADLGVLVPLLAHPHWAVRAEAIQALADRRVRSALPAALRRLDLEQDEFVREVLLRALARLEEA